MMLHDWSGHVHLFKTMTDFYILTFIKSKKAFLLKESFLQYYISLLILRYSFCHYVTPTLRCLLI